MSVFHGDGHVHLYPEFGFDAIVRRAETFARGCAGPVVLLLVEPGGRRDFESLSDGVTRTAEPGSLRIGEADAWLIHGRQIVSSEGVEVLAAAIEPADALAEAVDRTRTATELCRAAIDAGGLAVLPWGFGKWVGRRGAVVRDAAERFRREPRFFIGDVPARCWPWNRAAVLPPGVRVLAGTDPLPLPGEASRIGDYGFAVHGELDRDRPARSVVELLAAAAEIRSIGGRDGLLRTIGRQLRLRAARRSAP